MLFSSLTFIFIFLPVVFVLYTVPNHRWRNGVLLVTSLLFYAWGGVTYSAILCGSILMNFLIGRKIKYQEKLWITLGIILNLLVLVIFKYTDFFIENINLIFSSDIPLTHIKLPLGISFFTFQGVSFLIDVYRNNKKQKITLGETALYISFFPQLIAGPIIRYDDIIEQIRVRSLSIFDINKGLQRFILGLFKKVVVANTMGLIADQIMKNDYMSLGSSAAWLGIVAYSLQIYYDFSAYSDMAIGLGKMLGFDILENFNYPYISTSIREFWRRWHMSLSTWFRDYLYIPLGGNRKGNGRTYVNLIIVFLLTGFWHGATWSFVFWGAFHGLFMILERLFLGKWLKQIPQFFNWMYMILVVMIAWVFFRIEDFGKAVEYVKLLFSFKGTGLSYIEFLNNEKIIVLFIAILFSMPIYPWAERRLTQTKFASILSFVRVNLLLPAIFIYTIAVLTGSTYNPFIYFRF